MEQALISATTSAEALTAILSRAQKDAGRNRIGEQDDFAEIKPAHKHKGRKKRLEWLDLNGGSILETHMEHVDNLTSVEKRLLARYRNLEFNDDVDSFAPRPSSMPTESFLSRPPHALLLSRSQPRPAEGDEEPRVELAGGSYAAPYVPSDHSSTTHSSAPASPTSATAAHPHVPGGWMPRSKALGGAGLKHAIKEADEAAQVHPTRRPRTPPQRCRCR